MGVFYKKLVHNGRMTVYSFPQIPKPTSGVIFFDRKELDTIMRLYGQKVAKGEWRDYSLETFEAGVAFCVYRSTAEMAIYRIEKRPELARKQGAYALVNQTGQTLKRGNELSKVLAPLDKDRLKSI
jgi:hypothetical protein